MPRVITVLPTPGVQMNAAPGATVDFGPKAVSVLASFLPVRSNYAVSVTKHLYLTPSVVAITSSVLSVEVPKVLVPNAVRIITSKPVPNPSLVFLGVGTLPAITPTSLKWAISSPAVNIAVNGTISPSVSSVTVFSLFLPALDFGPLEVAPDSATASVVASSVSLGLSLTLSPDPAVSDWSLPAVNVAVNQLLTPGGAPLSIGPESGLGFPKVTVIWGESVRVAEPASYAFFAPEASVSLGPISKSVGLASVNFGVGSVSINETVGHQSARCLINDSCPAYCLVTDWVNAYCEVTAE